MKLFEDSLEFEVSDFEYTESIMTPEMFEFFGDRPGKLYVNIPKMFAKTYTHSVNRRLKYFYKGKKSKNTKMWAISIFEYLWRTGTPEEQFESFRWISRSDILKNCRKVGRPKTISNDDGSHESSYLHYTALVRILQGMEEVELIESKPEIVNQDIMPDKKKKNWFYRISRQTINEAVTKGEQIKKLEEQLKNLRGVVVEVIRKSLAIIEISENKGIPISKNEIEGCIASWNEGKSD